MSRKSTIPDTSMKAKLVRNRLQIKAKLEGLRSCYQETLDAFKLQLDSIVMPVIDRSDALISGSEEDFLKNASDIWRAIDKCGEKLININLLFCEEVDCGDDIKENMNESNSQKDVGHAKEKCTFVTEQLVGNQTVLKMPENCEVSSGDGGSFLFTDTDTPPIDKKINKLSRASSNNQFSVNEEDATSNVSESLHIASLNDPSKSGEEPASSKSVLAFCRSDEHMDVVVCDTTSPDLFYVQLLDWMEILFTLQQDLNDLHCGVAKSLGTVIEPQVGMACVAMYPCDQCWYRAEILEVLPHSMYRVFYIDYGNMAEVKHDNIRKFTKDFEEVPRLAIKCQLLGVHPKNEFGKWSPRVKVWYNKFVYGKQFEIKFHGENVNKNNGIYHVSLFEVSESKTLWNVATSLIYLGFAVSKDKCTCCHPILNEQTSLNSGEKLKLKQSAHNHCNTFSKSNSVSLSCHHDCPAMLPAGSEGNFLTRKKDVSKNLKKGSKKSASRFHPQQLSHWNPMLEDFSSHRNNYATDIDDACVAVENINWQRIRVCKYFLKGDCWRGKNCNFSHVQSGALYENPTFLFGSISTLEIEEHGLVYVKVTNIVTPPHLFYGNVLGVADSEMQPSKTFARKGDTLLPKDLDNLTVDMKHLYSKDCFRRRVQFNERCLCGEMYVIVEQQCYCRVTVTAVGKNDCVKVFLIDYGNSLWVNKQRLFQFCQAFLHLPAQAVLLQNESAIRPVASHVYLGQVTGCDKICDGPTHINLLEEM